MNQSVEIFGNIFIPLSNEECKFQSKIEMLSDEEEMNLIEEFDKQVEMETEETVEFFRSLFEEE